MYDSFNGVVLIAEEGHNIAKALGNKKAALLQNHGLLTTGKTVEEAVFVSNLSLQLSFQYSLLT